MQQSTTRAAGMPHLSRAEKKKRLAEILGTYERLAVAFSGGVDSAFLLAAARDVLGDGVTAITVDAPIHSRREVREAGEIARQLGVRHMVVALAEMTAPDFVANPPSRCYTCKKILFAEIARAAASCGVQRVAHGVNRDDLGDFRPGLRAAEEMGVVAPLVEAGLDKADIRALSRRMGLPTWNKPSMACLASRIPYGRPITRESLKMIEAAEEILQMLGFAGTRVRHHGDVARIELAARDVQKAMRRDTRSFISAKLKAIGFTHVSLDLDGYSSGSLNRALKNQCGGQ
jgi:uncharacterized protein